MTRPTESDHVRSSFTTKLDDGSDCNCIVFDLVLYHGRWNENKKHGLCEHFVTYRNYYVPALAETFEENKDSMYLAATNYFRDFRHNLHAVKTTTLDAIVKEAQLLSGCFFSGEWHKDLLSQGSLFYFHRFFCLHCKRKSSEVPNTVIPPPASSEVSVLNTDTPNAAPAAAPAAAAPPAAAAGGGSGWLGNDCEVTYFDCSTGSHFDAEWTNVRAVSGVWNMGSVIANPNKDTEVQRIKELSSDISSSVAFKKMTKNRKDRNESEHIDIKDGEFLLLAPFCSYFQFTIVQVVRGAW